MFEKTKETRRRKYYSSLIFYFSNKKTEELERSYVRRKKKRKKLKRNSREIVASWGDSHGREGRIPCRCDGVKYLDSCVIATENDKLVLKRDGQTIASTLSERE